MANNHDGRSSLLLSEAETWTASVIEERAVELVRIATRGLTMSDSSYDTRMDCLRWLGERLVTHIDVFDLEELVLKPFLDSALDFLEEIIEASEGTTQQNTILLTKIMINILQQSINVSIPSRSFQRRSDEFNFRWSTIVPTSQSAE